MAAPGQAGAAARPGRGLIPDAGTHQTTISLTRVESAKSVDFADGVVWILVLGSDARPGQELTQGNSDVIQLVGIDLQSGRAAGIGIPRDSYFEASPAWALTGSTKP